MNLDNTASLMGNAVRAYLARRGANKGEPVAYLYGQDKVRLPKLPDWDKEAYPYAIIVEAVNSDDSCTRYSLYLAKTIDIFDSEYLMFSTYNGPFLEYNYNTDSDNFTFEHDSESYAGTVYYRKHIWNYPDFVDNQGKVFAKSEPVPVYE